MRGVIEHGAFVLAVTCLAAAGLRVAGAADATGIVRAVTAAAAIVLETLLLGLVGLSRSAPALLAAAVITWVAMRLTLPAGRPGMGAQLGAWWCAAGPARRG